MVCRTAAVISFARARGYGVHLRIFAKISGMQPFRQRTILLLATSLFLLSLVARGQSYVGRFLRQDSLPLVFNLDVVRAEGKTQWVIRNGAERIRVDGLRRSGDSLFVDMPFFESAMKLQINRAGIMRGIWIKGTPQAEVLQPVVLKPGKVRFARLQGSARVDVSGRWSVRFRRPDGTYRAAVAEFCQQGSRLTGTFLTPTGDYRYLEGQVSGDSLQLSCFDGSHAFYFGARMFEDGSLRNGVFASGLTHLEPWTAIRDEEAALDAPSAGMTLRPGADSLHFQFPDLEGRLVSMRDDRFRDKVLIVQIMGSWCPNCMDETAFLSDYYRKNRARGIEVIALAYEYSTDTARARRSLAKFRDRFNVDYPLLITGVTSADSLRTEKTLPELTPIRAFPSTLFIGRDGKVKFIHAGFSGPATGLHHEAFRQEFEDRIRQLLELGVR